MLLSSRYYKTLEEKIIYYHDHGCSVNKIRKYTGCRSAKIIYCIRNYEITGEIPKAKKRGRPTKLTNSTLESILSSTIENRAKPAYQIAKELSDKGICEISASTVNRGRHKLELNYKPPKIKQFLTEQQKSDRVKFAHSLLANDFPFEKLVFSDESRFCSVSDKKFRWYRKEDCDEQCFATKEKFSTSIMIFGAIGIDFKSRLIICERSIDALYYREVLSQSNLIDSLDAKHGQGNWVFMQDGAPAHTAKITTLFLQKRMQFLKIWPANSPDLNPIEHLWGAMKRILKNTEIESKEHLIETIQNIWNNFPQDSINSLIYSFYGRLRLIIDQKGESISDLLRKGIHNIPEFPIPKFNDIWDLNELIVACDPSVNDNTIEVSSKLPWTSEEIILLMNKVKEFGTQWSKVALFFPNRTPASLRNKFKQVVQSNFVETEF